MSVKCDNSICKFQIKGVCKTNNQKFETSSSPDVQDSNAILCVTFEYIDAEEYNEDNS